MKTRFVTRLGILALGFLSASMAQGATYYVAGVSITDLGNLGLPDSGALDINNRGVIVGYSKNTDDVRRAFRWQGGVMTDLGTPGSYSRSVAEGINDYNEIVGLYYGPDFDEFDNNAFYWSAGTGVVTLNRSLYPGATFDSRYVALARAINNQGVIVGTVESQALSNVIPHDPCYRSLPVQWANPYAAPSIVHCSDVGEGTNGAADINDSGWIVGFEYLGSSPDKGFIRKGATLTHVPAPLFGVNPKAFGVNEAGHLVGVADFGTSTYGIRWSGSGASAWLGSLPGGTYSSAREINDQDFITGTSDTAVKSGSTTVNVDRAYLWHADFDMYALPVPAGMAATSTYCSANALNNRNATKGIIQVVGSCSGHAIRWTVQVLSH